MLQASSTHRDAQERRAIACTDCVTRRATSKMKFQICTICFYNPFFFLSFFPLRKIRSREFSRNFHLIKRGNRKRVQLKYSVEILLSNGRNGKEFLDRKSGQRNRRYIFFIRTFFPVRKL